MAWVLINLYTQGHTHSLIIMTFAVYLKHGHQPTTVRYAHLTEQQAQDECDRINDNLTERGIQACAWYEAHHPECVFVIG